MCMYEYDWSIKCGPFMCIYVSSMSYFTTQLHFNCICLEWACWSHLSIVGDMKRTLTVCVCIGLLTVCMCIGLCVCVLAFGCMYVYWPVDWMYVYWPVDCMYMYWHVDCMYVYWPLTACMCIGLLTMYVYSLLTVRVLAWLHMFFWDNPVWLTGY